VEVGGEGERRKQEGRKVQGAQRVSRAARSRARDSDRGACGFGRFNFFFLLCCWRD
jgi:hypothetical protein